MPTLPARSLLISLALVVALAVPAAVGAHGGDPSVIHACVQQSSQQVRIVGPNDPCRGPEIAVHWSIAGPQGLPGSQGPQGPTGQQGPRGPSGGTIQGRLTACGPQNFLGALVYAPGTSFIAITNDDGRFAISHVLPGTYNLVVELPGHAPAMLQDHVTVADDQITDIGDVQTTDTSADAQNCGACGHACSTGQSCTAGTCVTSPCPAGTTNCNGTCVNTSADAQNCGACGHACSAGQSCTAGTCVTSPCPAGRTNCNGTCVDTSTDTQNCGACGVVCSFAHGAGACSAGSCTLVACNAGFGDCDGNPANGCETNLNTRLNCGFCGEVCPVGSTCQFGACTDTCPGGICP